MALLPPYFLNTVAALGTRGDDGTVNYTATGFLISRPHEPEDDNPTAPRRWLFLVTNRHVADAGNQLVVRINRVDGSDSYIHDLNAEPDNISMSWTKHPDPETDVAVRLVHFGRLIPDGSEPPSIRSRQHTFSLEQVRESGISEGTGVFVLGFPLGIAGEERNQAIVRQGIVARIQGWLNGRNSDFLIDGIDVPRK